MPAGQKAGCRKIKIISIFDSLKELRIVITLRCVATIFITKTGVRQITGRCSFGEMHW